MITNTMEIHTRSSDVTNRMSNRVYCLKTVLSRSSAATILIHICNYVSHAFLAQSNLLKLTLQTSLKLLAVKTACKAFLHQSFPSSALVWQTDRPTDRGNKTAYDTIVVWIIKQSTYMSLATAGLTISKTGRHSTIECAFHKGLSSVPISNVQ